MSNSLPQKEEGKLYALAKYRIAVIQTREHFKAMQEQREEKNAYKIILDEAKKEYLSFFGKKYPDNTTIPEINRQLNYKQQEWFKKWFGDAEV